MKEKRLKDNRGNALIFLVFTILLFLIVYFVQLSENTQLQSQLSELKQNQTQSLVLSMECWSEWTGEFRINQTYLSYKLYQKAYDYYTKELKCEVLQNGN